MPRLLAEVGPSGMLRTHIDGANLKEFRDAGGQPAVDFFPRLGESLALLHAAGVCHNDLGKPENLLVDQTGRGWIIDFQIALRPGGWPLGLGSLFGWLTRRLQKVDAYHLRKNWRRARPQDFTAEEQAAARRRGWLLSAHYHLVRNPYRAVRHFFLRRFLAAPGAN